MAYLCGVILGDGYYGKNSREGANAKYKYVMLKSVDSDFLDKFVKTIEVLTGKKYAIYQTVDKANKNRKPLHICRCYSPELVNETVFLTRNKTEIPNFVIDGDCEDKKQLIQGLMDSEGYITFSLNPLKQSSISLWFANTSDWSKDFWYLVQSIGINVSKLYLRKMKDGRKNVHYFKIDILDYVNSGLSFNIKRKSERLDYIANILRDYMRRYKHEYRVPVQDIVQHSVKAE